MSNTTTQWSGRMGVKRRNWARQHRSDHTTRARRAQFRLHSEQYKPQLVCAIPGARACLWHTLDDTPVWVQVRLGHIVAADHMRPAAAAGASQRAARH